MERRNLLRTIGGIGVTASLGSAALIASTGGAAAANTTLEATDPSAVTTDGGDIKYVAFGGRLRFKWDGLDNAATYGWYKTESRVKTGNSWSPWRTHGTDYGELGSNWGGDNDYTQDTGSDGYFQFKYGSSYNQPSYAIAGNGSGVVQANNPYGLSLFEAETDGGTESTKVQFRKTCRVYDGEPENGGTVQVEDSGMAMFTVTVNNRAVSATTGGEVEGEIGADES